MVSHKSKNSKKPEATPERISEFLADLHFFTNKWNLTSVSEGVLGITKQAGHDRVKVFRKKQSTGSKK